MGKHATYAVNKSAVTVQYIKCYRTRSWDSYYVCQFNSAESRKYEILVLRNKYFEWWRHLFIPFMLGQHPKIFTNPVPIWRKTQYVSNRNTNRLVLFQEAGVNIRWKSNRKKFTIPVSTVCTGSHNISLQQRFPNCVPQNPGVSQQNLHSKTFPLSAHNYLCRFLGRSCFSALVMCAAPVSQSETYRDVFNTVAIGNRTKECPVRLSLTLHREEGAIPKNS
jgi:hypothetical protein